MAGRQVFSVAIDARGSATGQLDWRRDHSALLDQWVPTTLPAEVETGLLALLDLLGLNFGAIDMIGTPDGRYVILEANANGGGFEGVYRAGLPVAEGIARLLAGLEERRRVREQGTAGEQRPNRKAGGEDEAVLEEGATALHPPL